MSSFYVENFGCRATQADGAAIEHQFRDRGLDRAASSDTANWVVLNTCAVTAAAEQDARAAIRRLRRQNPGCKIVVTGCYAQRVPADVAQLDGVAAVIGNSHKHTLAQIALAQTSQTSISSREFVPVSDLQRSASAAHQPQSETDPALSEAGTPFSNSNPTSAAQRRNLDSPARECRENDATETGVRFSGRHNSQHAAEIFVSDIFAHTELLAAPVFDSANERTRPNLKIQDGCNNRCSFCIIPSVRGRSRSLKLDDVLREVNQLVAAGYREVVISGINLGRWGRDLAVWRGHSCPRLEDLVRAILSETSLEKLRISSVEPMDWTDSFIQLMADSSRIAKHAHVPMQSGSDSVLRRMHRKYRPWHYREKVEKIRAAMPTAAIGADVMVGFPGETDAEFDETRRMIEDLPFTYLHVFTFSARPGTPAATMPNQVPVQVARERNRILRDLAAEKKRAFMQSFVGRELEAITLAGNSSIDSFADPKSGSARLPVVPKTGPYVTYGTAEGRALQESLERTNALTDNYLKLSLCGIHSPNSWVKVLIESVEDGALIGRLDQLQ